MTAALYTLEEALRLAAEYHRNPIKDKAYQHMSRLGASVRDYLAWKETSGAAERTLDSYERADARLASAVDKDIADVNVDDLMGVLITVTPGQRHGHRAAWSDLFKWALLTGRRTSGNPVHLLPKAMPTPVPVYDIFAQEELAAIVDAARTMRILPFVNEIRALLLTETGMRAGGAMHLRVRDVNLRERRVRLREKGNKERLVPIRGEVVQAFDRYLMEPYPLLNREPAPDDYLWFPRDASGIGLTAIYPEQPLKYGAFRQWWVKLLERADVRYRSPHMSRHTYGTNVMDATEGKIYAVQNLLGHASPKTTEKYLHSSTLHMDSAVDALEAFRNRHHD